MTKSELAKIKSHPEQWDSTCFNVRRAFEDRDALIAGVERLRNLLRPACLYVEGYAENENNHPQARDAARDLVRQIKEAIG